MTTNVIPDRSGRLCDFPRCGRPTQRGSFTPYCSKHAAQAYANGAPGRAGIRESDYRPYNLWVSEGIARYRQTKATEAALTLAEQLLNFTPVHQFRSHRNLHSMVMILQGDQVTPSDILHRVCLHVAFATANPQRYSGNQRVEQLAMARVVMRLVPLRRSGKKWPTKALLLLAQIIQEDGLYLYALKLIDRLKQNDAARLALKTDAALGLDEPAEVPAERRRVGVSYRKRRGVQVP